MLKISEAVRTIILSSEVALSALAEGYLNLSAYAKEIRYEVEKITKKEVKLGSIVIALSRLTPQIKTKPLLPNAMFENISIKKGLMKIAFHKTKETQNKLSHLLQVEEFILADFFTLSEGNSEISIVAPESLLQLIKKTYKGDKPKLVFTGLTGVTLRFDEKHYDIPNVIYLFVRSLALKRINIAAIVSAFTEISFVVRESDLEETFSTLNQMFKNTSPPR